MKNWHRHPMIVACAAVLLGAVILLVWHSYQQEQAALDYRAAVGPPHVPAMAELFKPHPIFVPGPGILGAPISPQGTPTP